MCTLARFTLRMRFASVQRIPNRSGKPGGLPVVSERSGPAQAGIRSVRAGADLVLTTGAGSHLKVVRALLAEARRSPAFRARVAESAARVLALKRDLGLRNPQPS